jgi:hypothetical protein
MINVSKDVEIAIDAAVQSGQFAAAGEMIDQLVGVAGQQRAALDDRPAEAPLGRRHRHEGPDLPPPPDWPKIVTHFGSPPKRAMLSRTHSTMATRSCKPTLAERLCFSPPMSARFRYPNTLRR